MRITGKISLVAGAQCYFFLVYIQSPTASRSWLIRDMHAASPEWSPFTRVLIAPFSWLELSGSPTASQIFILFRKTKLNWDGNSAWRFNGHTKGTSRVPKFCSSGGLFPEIPQRKGRSRDPETPLFKSHWGDMKVCVRWKGSGWQLLIIKANFEGQLNCCKSCIW